MNLTGTGAPRALNQLAREQMIHRLLADIRIDLTVCELEGIDPTEYLHRLHKEIAHFHPCERMTQCTE